MWSLKEQCFFILLVALTASSIHVSANDCLQGTDGCPNDCDTEPGICCGPSGGQRHRCSSGLYYLTLFRTPSLYGTETLCCGYGCCPDTYNCGSDFNCLSPNGEVIPPAPGLGSLVSSVGATDEPFFITETSQPRQSTAAGPILVISTTLRSATFTTTLKEPLSTPCTPNIDKGCEPTSCSGPLPRVCLNGQCNCVLPGLSLSFSTSTIRAESTALPKPTSTHEQPPPPPKSTLVEHKLGTRNCHDGHGVTGDKEISKLLSGDFARLLCMKMWLKQYRMNSESKPVSHKGVVGFPEVEYTVSIKWKEGCRATVDSVSPDAPLHKDGPSQGNPVKADDICTKNSGRGPCCIDLLRDNFSECKLFLEDCLRLNTNRAQVRITIIEVAILMLGAYVIVPLSRSIPGNQYEKLRKFVSLIQPPTWLAPSLAWLIQDSPMQNSFLVRQYRPSGYLYTNYDFFLFTYKSRSLKFCRLARATT